MFIGRVKIRRMGFKGNIHYLVLGKTLTYSNVSQSRTNYLSMEEAGKGRRLVVNTID